MATLQNDSLARESEVTDAELWTLAEHEPGFLSFVSDYGSRWQDEYERRIELSLCSAIWPHYPETPRPTMRPVLPIGQANCIKLAADLARRMSGSWYQYFVEVARDAVGQRIDKDRPDSRVIEHWIGCYEFRWLRAAIRRDAPQLLPLIPIMDVTPLGEAEFRQSMRKLEGELRCLLREPISGDLPTPTSAQGGAKAAPNSSERKKAGPKPKYGPDVAAKLDQLREAGLSDDAIAKQMNWLVKDVQRAKKAIEQRKRDARQKAGVSPSPLPAIASNSPSNSTRRKNQKNS